MKKGNEKKSRYRIYSQRARSLGKGNRRCIEDGLGAAHREETLGCDGFTRYSDKL